MVNKLCLITCAFVIYTSSLFGQSLSPNVIASSGNVDVTNNITLEWTLGEVFVKTGQVNTNYLTEGYHQPITVKSIDDNTNSTYSISIAPNPVNSILYITISSEENEQLTIRLMNANAKILYTDKANSNNDLKEIDMSSYQSGMYILNIISDSGTFYKSYKISKI